MEVYSPPRVIPFVGELGCPGGLSAYLITGWSFVKADARIAIVIEVKVCRPRVLILSPPCTWFSSLQNLNWWKLPREYREQQLREVILHVEFSCFLMRLQIHAGRKVIFEHPKTALSFKYVKQLLEIMRSAGIMVFDIDQCIFGLASPVGKSSPEGNVRSDQPAGAQALLAGQQMPRRASSQTHRR